MLLWKSSIIIFVILVQIFRRLFQPLIKPFLIFLPEPTLECLFLVPTIEEELLDIVRSLKNKKSPGFDYIKNDLIKHVITGILKPLTHVLTLSMPNYGVVPRNMQIAKVVPIFKKGDP